MEADKDVGMKSYRRDLKILARSLRGNMTDAEQKLWQALRCGRFAGVRFYRQKPVLDFIVDFHCPRAGLVIELDGNQHFEIDKAERDRHRSKRMAALGLKVLRFTNREVLLEREAVLTAIEEEMMARIRK
jgi:very-short-patch-repair endonuclease